MIIKITLGALLLFANGFVIAEGNMLAVDNSEIFEIKTDAVVISASRSETKLDAMPQHTTVITQDQIKSSPAQTIDQLLRGVPGLLIPGTPYFTTDPTGHNIKLRGMDKKVLVMVDGIPIHDPFYTTVQWFKVPLSSVERVEIIRGGSSIWGNMAVGGVINIISKAPTKGGGVANFSAGSMNSYSGSVSKSVVVSDNFSFNISADVFDTDGYNNTRDQYRSSYYPGRGNSSADTQNLRLTGFFNPSEDLKGFFRVGFNRQNQQIGGYEYGTNEQKSPDLQASISNNFDEKNRVTANFWAQWLDFNKYNGAACYASYKCGVPLSSAAGSSSQTSPIIQYATSLDIMRYHETGASAVYSKDMRGWVSSLQLGADYRGITGDDQQTTYRVPTLSNPQILRIQRTNVGEGQQDFYGLFTQFKINLIEPLEITVGARVDHYRSSNGIAIQSNYSDDGYPVLQNAKGGPVLDSSKTSFNPNISARYDVSDQLAFRASAYKAFRAPGMNNMYRTYGSSVITVANPYLKPETLIAEEIGVDWRDKNFNIGATLFRADVKDLVTSYTVSPTGVIPDAVQAICGGAVIGHTADLCSGTVAYNTNGQDQRAQGLELVGSVNVKENLVATGYYTYTSTYYTAVTTSDPVNKQLSLVPKNVVGVGLNWQASPKFTATIDARYNSTMALNLTSGSTVAQQQAGYVVANFSAVYKFSKTLDGFLAVNNIFDKEYSDSSASKAENWTLAMARSATIGFRSYF
jgi:iron complex outermembrane receptor protein